MRAINTNPSPVHTTVIDYVSPPALVAEKEQQLQEIGPSGWRRLALYRLLSLPVWIAYTAQLLRQYATRLPVLLRQPDPGVFQLQPPFALHEEWLDVNGVRLHAVSPVRRRPNKPLLLLLHGWPESWYSWRHLMAAFAESDWDVVALDLRGFAGSSKPQGVDSYQMGRVAEDVRAAVALLGHSSCTLVAHDWGGLVAWTVAGLYGSSLVRRLVVMALPHIGVATTNYNLEEYWKLNYQLFFQAQGLAELYVTADNAAALDGFFRGEAWGVKNQSALTDADIHWFRAAMCQPGAATASLSYYRAFHKFTTRSDPDDPVWQAWRRRLEMPALVLHGDSDGALGMRLLRGIEAAVPDVTVKILERCSHWVQQDYPQQVNEIVMDWLRAKQEQCD